MRPQLLEMYKKLRRMLQHLRSGMQARHVSLRRMESPQGPRDKKEPRGRDFERSGRPTVLGMRGKRFNDSMRSG